MKKAKNRTAAIICRVFIVLALFFVVPGLWAYDLGLVLDQNAGLSGTADGISVNYSASLIPRFSTLLADSGELYISAALGLSYENEEWAFIPELLRTDFSFRSGNLGIRAGRMLYADPLDFVAEGLFDGAQFSLDTSAGTFSAGTWYTGLLYKKRSNITITKDDLDSYFAPVDFDDFSNTYFAPRRVIAALGWDHPAIAEVIRLRVALSAQFDLNDYAGADAFNSQYASVKAVMPFSSFVFEAGGVVQTAQTGDEFSFGFAGVVGASWTLPTSFRSRISFNGQFSSGKNSTLDAFVPITTKSQGDILKAKLSGLSVLTLDYTARLHQNFSITLNSSYFVCSDMGTYQGYPLETGNRDGYFLGNEFAGRFIWSPASDLRLNLGACVFLPSLGNAAPDADLRWRLEMGLVLALY